MNQLCGRVSTVEAQAFPQLKLPILAEGAGEPLDQFCPVDQGSLCLGLYRRLTESTSAWATTFPPLIKGLQNRPTIIENHHTIIRATVV